MRLYALTFFYFIFRILPVDIASGLGGNIARLIGPKLAVSRKAKLHLSRSLPDEDHAKIIQDMWENLGRVMAEYPHLKYISKYRTSVESIEILEDIRDDGIGGMLYTGHLANWEVCGSAADILLNLQLDVIYRAPNNPYVDKLLNKARSHKGRLKTIPKSREGAKQIIKSLRKNRHIGILIDQKYNEGIEVNFFGQPANDKPCLHRTSPKI